jgi:hypothetical protein
MAKTVLMAVDVKELAVSEMQRHKGCEEIADVSILPFSDPRIETPHTLAQSVTQQTGPHFICNITVICSICW